jgi:sulfur carrier protein
MGIKITVNGEVCEFGGATLSELLLERGLTPDQGGLAVAINGSIALRSEWSEITILPSDNVEIVHIVRGG